MKNERKTEIKVGITVFLAIIIFLFVLGWAKNINLGKKENIISVRFDNIAGLAAGDAVMVKGYKCGRIDEIIVDKNEIIASLVIDEGIVVYDDAKFYIMMLDLMGGKKVEIDPGSRGELDENKIYEGEFLGDISTAMAMLSSVQSDLILMTKELRVTLTQTNEILTDANFKDNLKAAVASLSEAGIKLNKFISENDDQLNELIKNTDTLVQNTSGFITENKDGIKSLISSSQQFLDNSAKVIEKLDAFIDDMDREDSNLNKVLHDPELYPNLKYAMEKVKELTEILIKQLKTDGLNVDVF